MLGSLLLFIGRYEYGYLRAFFLLFAITYQVYNYG